MNDDGTLWKWVLTAIGAIGGALSVAVTTLWKHAEQRNTERIKELNDRVTYLEVAHRNCEERYHEALLKLAELTREISELHDHK